MRKIIMILLIGGFCVCCGQNSQPIKNQEIIINGDEITVSANASVLKKIKIEKVNITEYSPQFSTSGIVQAIPTLYAEIATPFSGRITKSFIRLGDKVKKGTPLFELSSPSFFETTKAYFEAKQERDKALKDLNREQDLLANKVGVKKEVEEAEVNYNLKKQDFANATSALKVFQVNPQNVKLGEPLIVFSPITGTIVKNEIVIGQYIKEDSPSLATVADLNRVWVVAHVKEKDIKLIERLQTVDIRLSSSPDKCIKGTIFHISDMLDKETRSVEVIIECDNRNGEMKPNMYGSVQLVDKPSKAIIIPTSAILQEEEHNYVIKEIGKNKFSKIFVEIGSTIDNNSTVITKGISSGDEIITEGAFYLLDSK